MSHDHVLSDPDAPPYTPPGPPAPDPTQAVTGTEPPEVTRVRQVRATDAAATQARMWLNLSALFSDQVPAIADREDISVSIGPGAGRGAPGCFVPALASLELDATILTDLGIDPVTCSPHLPSDRDRYPSAWGVFTHECAHARHTRWDPPTRVPGTGAAAAAVSASMMLEESRIEAAHLTRRPGDRRWLRAAATTIILPDILTLQLAAQAAEPEPSTPESPPPATAQAASTTSEPEKPAAQTISRTEPDAAGDVPEPIAHRMSLWSAARAVGLLLARVDAGVLDEDETTAVSDLVTPILGPTRLDALRDIWCEAQATADDDDATMLRLGRDWCTVLGIDPDNSDPSDDVDLAADEDLPSPLTAAVITTLGSIVAADTSEAPANPGGRRSSREAEISAQRTAQAAADRVFDPGRGATTAGATAITGTRLPTDAEKTAARRLARALRAAGTRDRIAVTSTSATPPGRLSMRGAMAADAQRAAGATPSAQPFTRTTRHHVPTPPLRIGIACDVSGSMSAAAPVIASTAWILNRATGFIPDAQAATVIYGRYVRAITRPGQIPSEVSIFAANDGYEAFTQALDALDAGLDLTRRDAARLLVIVSDGDYKADEPKTGQQRITRLRASGCAVLWIGMDTSTEVMKGATPLILTDPTTATEAIIRAATIALRDA